MDEVIAAGAPVLWGAATAAYQVEGATDCDGKGRNSWDAFYEREHLGYDGSVAVDHYHHVDEDLQLFHEIGLQSYRFSVSWSRIFPQGTGELNERGLAFYDHVVDTLLGYGIEPYLTLYHWDLPLPLLENGGWFNPDTIEAFVAYARVLFEHFRGRVKLWATINEPASEVIEGYVQGTHPPQERDYAHAMQVAHHYNVASARAIRLFRALRMPGKIGVVLNPMPVDAADDSVEAARARDIAYDYLSDWYLGPALAGRYPERMLRFCQERYGTPVITHEEARLLAENVGDYLGINYYMRRVVAPGDLEAEGIEDRYRFVRVPGGRYTKWGWEIYPQGLSDLLHRIRRDYGDHPIVIAENGIGFDDQADSNGDYNDEERIGYLREHTAELLNLRKEGFDIRAYYVWSAIDLLSWTNGYQKRYGLIGVDFDTLERRIKKSGYWYRDFIAGAL